MKIYAIKDVKIGFYNPFYLQNDAVAIREFTNGRNDSQKNAINTNPEDKELWSLGEFDERTGEIKSEVRFLIKAEDCVIKRGE